MASEATHIINETGRKRKDSDMTVIAISNLKGGTGKTTTAILLATALTRLGYTATVVDLDPQGSATEWAHLAAESGTPLALPRGAGQYPHHQKPPRNRGLRYPGLSTRQPWDHRHSRHKRRYGHCSRPTIRHRNRTDVGHRRHRWS
ncbi:tetraacyldisaccharide 4'-kinase [Corynebacterium belfantii]|nr:tetraacyldisaccharide 4'-kinase [Corynebacterium belfantii]